LRQRARSQHTSHIGSQAPNATRGEEIVSDYRNRLAGASLRGSEISKKTADAATSGFFRKVGLLPQQRTENKALTTILRKFGISNLSTEGKGRNHQQAPGLRTHTEKSGGTRTAAATREFWLGSEGVTATSRPSPGLQLPQSS